MASSIGAAKVLQNDIEDMADEAVQVLEKVAKERNMIGFGSKIALSIWRGEMSGDPNTWKKRKDTSEK